jgi:hypothetical protein
MRQPEEKGRETEVRHGRGRGTGLNEWTVRLGSRDFILNFKKSVATKDVLKSYL